jgi:hypothetical protein
MLHRRGWEALRYQRQLTRGRRACGLLRYNETKSTAVRITVIDAGFLETGAVSQRGTNISEYKATKSVS